MNIYEVYITTILGLETNIEVNETDMVRQDRSNLRLNIPETEQWPLKANVVWKDRPCQAAIAFPYQTDPIAIKVGFQIKLPPGTKAVTGALAVPVQENNDGVGGVGV